MTFPHGPAPVALDLEPRDSAAARFADQVRRLVDATVRTDVDPEVLADVADELRAAREQITGSMREHSAQHDPDRDPGAGLPYRRTPVLGGANPLAPPVELQSLDGEVRAITNLHHGYEGPPGYVHGGIVGLLLDDLLGLANIVAGMPGVTIGLDVHYRRPTPLRTDLLIHAVHDRVEGQDAIARGSITVDGEVTATAEARFRMMSTDRIQAGRGTAGRA